MKYYTTWHDYCKEHKDWMIRTPIFIPNKGWIYPVNKLNKSDQIQPTRYGRVCTQ